MVGSYQIEAPSGYIDTGETPIEAANRELKEETGYRANNIISLGSYTLDILCLNKQAICLSVMIYLMKRGSSWV